MININIKILLKNDYFDLWLPVPDSTDFLQGCTTCQALVRIYKAQQDLLLLLGAQQPHVLLPPPSINRHQTPYSDPHSIHSRVLLLISTNYQIIWAQ